MAISKAQRDAMPEGQFAFPRTRQGPMPDENHTQLAWDMIDRTKGVSEDERTDARGRVLARAKDLGMDTAKWRKLKAMSFEVQSLEAMALNMPECADHPNRMPFSGVLTKLDQPSDRPVHGSLGKLVIIPTAVAEAALSSLLGMAIDFTPGLDGHDPKQKIGIITAASIDGEDLRIEGFLYAADFPEEAALIKARKSELGFSYETAQNFTESLDTEHLVLAACVFTGAAILRKDKAAYQTTSLAASAAGDVEMTKEELEAILTAHLKPVNDEIALLKASSAQITTDLKASREVQTKVKPHADSLRACADAMSAAGIGQHPTGGHVVKLNRMADQMEAAAALGETPHVYRDHDYAGGSWNASAEDGKGKPEGKTDAEKALEVEVSTLKTKVADLTAASADKTPPPERKTVPPHIATLLAKAGPDSDGKVTMAKLEASISHLEPRDRIAIKRNFQASGLLADAA